MNENIIIAIISLIGTILVAIITGIFKLLSKDDDKSEKNKTSVKQSAKSIFGSNIQIGTQTNYFKNGEEKNE